MAHATAVCGAPCPPKATRASACAGEDRKMDTPRAGTSEAPDDLLGVVVVAIC